MRIIGRKEKELEAILDTGSPYTVIPLNICEEVGLKIEGFFELKGIFGVKQSLPAFRCKIEIVGQRRNALIFGHEKFNLMLVTIIGRNLLQEFTLELDWKKRTIKMEDPT